MSLSAVYIPSAAVGGDGAGTALIGTGQKLGLSKKFIFFLQSKLCDVTVTPSMTGYAKLFTRILDSTIWREDDKTRILWITMLALANQDGIVLCTIPGLADRARISLPECEAALARFQLPDKYSWSQEKEGRRVEVVEGGWFLINHAKYRAMMSADEQREKTRLRVQRWRQKNTSQTVTPVTGNESNDIADTKAKADTKAIKGFVRPTFQEVRNYCLERRNSVNPQKWLDHYTSNGWKVGRNSMKDWKATVRKWETSEFNSRPSYQENALPLDYESPSEKRSRELGARKAAGL